jgi:hypothetical protein
MQAYKNIIGDAKMNITTFLWNYYLTLDKLLFVSSDTTYWKI